MERKCPDCHGTLTNENFEGIDLDACPNCAGLWFDEGELRRVLTTDPIGFLALEDKCLPRAAVEPATSRVRACPGCTYPLHTYHYEYDSPIELDDCDHCGGCWVQEGELRKMQQWMDAHHSNLSADEKHKLTLAQAGIEHEETMQRLHSLRAFLTLLRLHRPRFYGT